MASNQEFQFQVVPPPGATVPSEQRRYGSSKQVEGDLPTIDDNGHGLAQLLRKYFVRHQDCREFWPLRLLRHILTRDRVLAKVPDIKPYIDYIHPAEERATESDVPSYLQVFALLVLLEREDEIGDFVQMNLCDEQLPVDRRTIEGKTELYGRNSPNQPLGCFKKRKWRDHEKEFFSTKQWQFLVPYFELDSDNKAQHYELHDSTILPWRHWNEYCPNSLQPTGQKGGYAYVSAVDIAPSSHGFHSVLKAVR
jgi:hypothetical protein